MLELLIKAGQFVYDFFNKERIAEVEDLKRVSELLKSISDLLDSVAIDLNNDIYPHGKCEAMRVLVQGIMEKLMHTLEPVKAKELYETLMSVTELERLYAERNTETIRQLQITAGKFYGASLLIKL